MGKFGTLIFSSDAQEEGLAIGDSDQLPSHQRPGGEREDCCALLICQCLKANPHKGGRRRVKGRIKRAAAKNGGGGPDGEADDADEPSAEAAIAEWETFLHQ